MAPYDGNTDEMPDLLTLVRHSTYRHGRDNLPPDPAAIAEAIRRNSSYQPLADALHAESKATAAPSRPADEDDGLRSPPPKRRETVFERTVRTSVERGRMSQEEADALLGNRYQEWLAGKRDSKAGSPAPRPGSRP